REQLQLPRARDVGEDGLDAAQVHGLDQVVGGAAAKRLHRGLDARVAGDENDLGGGKRAQLLQQLHAVPVRQVQVDEDHVGSGGGDRQLGGREAGGRAGGEALPGNGLGEGGEERLIVVHEQ